MTGAAVASRNTATINIGHYFLQMEPPLFAFAETLPGAARYPRPVVIAHAGGHRGGQAQPFPTLLL